MELLIITAVQAFEQDIKHLLKKSGVLAFSHVDVNGYKDSRSASSDENWFASSLGEYASVLFYAFAEEDHVKTLMEAIESWNEKESSESRIHVAVLDIKKHNTF
jgi:nitrogen regulatory protein PII